jgi:hypothetical protein
LHHANNPISTATIPPVEILEAAYPVMFTQWALRSDSGGAGEHRGGVGAVYEIEALAPGRTEIALLGERGRFAPFGVAGGADGALNRFTWGSAGETPPMASKLGGVSIGDLTDPGAGALRITDNLIPATAAKGINFTANTPAAGMTSQLLTWYEEGTFTPTFTNLTVVGTATYTGRYTRIGRMVYINLRIESTGSTSSTAGTTYANAGFPFVSANIFTAASTINTGTFANFATESLFGLSGGNTILYTATWTAVADVTITGFYFV